MCASLLALSSCQKHGEPEATTSGSGGEQGQEQGSDDGPSAPAKDDRIPELTAAPAGLAPGYLDDAMIYASLRAGALQELMQSMPISPREAKDMAELGAYFGVDLRIDDVLAQFGVAHDARVSLSVRPVLDHEADVTAAAMAEQPPSPEQLRKARAVGVHVRVHVPVAAAGKLDGAIASLAAELARDGRWANTCAALGPTRACGGQGDVIMVVRDQAGGRQLDALLTFVSNREQPDDELRRAEIQHALSVPAASSLPEVASLRGDATLLIDGPGLITTMRAAMLADLAARRAKLADEAIDEIYGLDHLRARAQALQQLHETERMFAGITVEAQLSKDRMLAVGRWRPTDYGRAHMHEVFELRNIDADVPSIAALCDGALVCGRSRGVSDRARFAALATGLYAAPKQLAELLDDHEDEALTVLLLETWPNAIGALSTLPGQHFQGPEAMMVQHVIDIGSRILGFGFSVRSLTEARGSVTGDWVAYARTNASDLAAVRGYLQIGELSLAPIDVPEIPGRVEFTPLPDVPGNLYVINDPKASTGEWGWAVLADADDRVRWLASLARDDGAVPLAYFEIGDLWRVAASFEDGREELGFSQSWLSRRWVRAQLSLDAGGAPQLRMAMGKLQ